MHPDAAPLKALLFEYLDTHTPTRLSGDGYWYVQGVLDCIHALTGQDRDQVLEEAQTQLYATQAQRTEALRLWHSGMARPDIQAQLNMSDGEWGRVRGLPP